MGGYAARRAYRRVVPGGEPPDEINEPMLIETWPRQRPVGQLTAAELRSRFPRMIERFGTPGFARAEA
jgi:hypothetical protein